MNEINVKVDRLKDKLAANMETHEADFELAWDAYAKKAVENVENVLKVAKNMKRGEQVSLYINLTAPENHQEDYVRALEMLDWHQEDEIIITEQEFAQFVQDDWGWKHQFASTNTFYTGSASPSSIRSSKRH